MLLPEKRLLFYCQVINFLEDWILHFCLVLSEFSPLFLHISVLPFHYPNKGELENWSEGQRKLQHCFQTRVHFCYWDGIVTKQRQFSIKKGEEEKLDGGLGQGCKQTCDVTDCIVSWETHPSNRHLWFCAGSLQKEAACPGLGHSGVLVCSKAGSVKLIHFVWANSTAEQRHPHSASLEIMTPRQSGSHCEM